MSYNLPQLAANDAGNIQAAWYKSSQGQKRLQTELAALSKLASSKSITINDLENGSTVFVIETTKPPGYILYLHTTPQYPREAPGLIGEVGNKAIQFSSKTTTNWRSEYLLAEVVTEAISSVVQRRLAVLYCIVGVTILFLLAIGTILLAKGITKIELRDVQGKVNTNLTALAIDSNNVSTAIAQATQHVVDNPQLANLPNSTLTAAVAGLLEQRNKNEQALATLTVIIAQNHTATAVAIQKSNSQTQKAFSTDLTKKALAAETATAVVAAFTSTPNPLPSTPAPTKYLGIVTTPVAYTRTPVVIYPSVTSEPTQSFRTVTPSRPTTIISPLPTNLTTATVTTHTATITAITMVSTPQPTLTTNTPKIEPTATSVAKATTVITATTQLGKERSETPPANSSLPTLTSTLLSFVTTASIPAVPTITPYLVLGEYTTNNYITQGIGLT